MTHDAIYIYMYKFGIKDPFKSLKICFSCMALSLPMLLLLSCVQQGAEAFSQPCFASTGGGRV